MRNFLKFLRQFFSRPDENEKSEEEKKEIEKFIEENDHRFW